MVIYIVRDDGCDYYNDYAAFTDLETAKKYAIKKQESMKFGHFFIARLALDPSDESEISGSYRADEKIWVAGEK